jgi:hypothetical protein
VSFYAAFGAAVIAGIRASDDIDIGVAGRFAQAGHGAFFAAFLACLFGGKSMGDSLFTALFFPVLPAANGFFDWLSRRASRYFIARLQAAASIGLIVCDLILNGLEAVGLFLGFAAAMPMEPRFTC